MALNLPQPDLSSHSLAALLGGVSLGAVTRSGTKRGWQAQMGILESIATILAACIIAQWVPREGWPFVSGIAGPFLGRHLARTVTVAQGCAFLVLCNCVLIVGLLLVASDPARFGDLGKRILLPVATCVMGTWYGFCSFGSLGIASRKDATIHSVDFGGAADISPPSLIFSYGGKPRGRGSGGSKFNSCRSNDSPDDKALPAKIEL